MGGAEARPGGADQGEDPPHSSPSARRSALAVAAVPQTVA